MASINVIEDVANLRAIPAAIAANPGAIAIENVAGILKQVNDQGVASSIGAGGSTSLPQLPAAWATCIMPLGDSMTSGEDTFGSVPAGTRVAVGATGGGAYRAHLIQIIWNLGIKIPLYQWMTGTFESTTDPNIFPGGNNWDHHQGFAGYAFPNITAAFPGWWATITGFGIFPGAILLMAGTNDWASYLGSHPGDFAGAAAFANANFATCLAQIKTTAGANTVVGFVTPPTGATHKVEALLSVPLFTATIAAAAAGGQRVYLVADASTPFAPPASGNTGLMQPDDIHLNEAGQRILAGLMLRGMLASPW